MKIRLCTTAAMLHSAFAGETLERSVEIKNESGAR
jgi:uncharacterized protein YjaG (DUF416 family)